MAAKLSSNSGSCLLKEIQEKEKSVLYCVYIVGSGVARVLVVEGLQSIFLCCIVNLCEMKFALGAAAAITGASALIYLLLRPRKRQLDPGKQRVTPACLTSSKDTYSGKGIHVTEEIIVQNKSEHRESDPNRANSDNNGFQTFNGHISVEDKSCNLGPDDAKCKISPKEQDLGVVGDDISREVASPIECKAQNVDSCVPCSFEDKPCSEKLVDSNDEVCAAVQNAIKESPAPVVKWTSEEALESVNHTDIQEGIISSTAGCEISECVSAILDSQQRGSNLDCDSSANDSCVTSSSFSEEKECTPVVHHLKNTSYSSPLKEESQQGISSSLENKPVTSSSVQEKEYVSAVIETGFGKGVSSSSQLSANEDLQKGKDLELEKEILETIPSFGMKSKMTDEISQNEIPAESFSEDSASAKSSLTEKCEQLEANSPAAELPVTAVSMTTELALDKQVEESPKAELPVSISAAICVSEVPAESIASASGKAVEEEIKAGVHITTSTSVESSEISNIESSEIKIVNESDAEAQQSLARDEALSGRTFETEVSSQSEKLQAECAEINTSVSGLSSSTDSQDNEMVASKDLVTNIMSKEEEPAYDFKCKSMWSECVDNSPRNSVTEEAFSSAQTGDERVSGNDDKAKQNTSVRDVDLVKKDEPSPFVDQKTNSKTVETSTLSSEQEPIPLAEEEDSPSSLDKSQRKKSHKDHVRNFHVNISDSASASSLEKRESEEVNCINLDQAEMEVTHGNSRPSFEIQEKSTTTSNSNALESGSGGFGAQEPISVISKEALSKEASPSSASNSQRKKSYRDRVRNSHGSTSCAAPESNAKKCESEGDACLNLDETEKELCCVMEDTPDSSVSSFIVKEKAATPSGSNIEEAVSSSPPMREIVIVDNKVSTPSAKKDSGHSKNSKAKKEGPSKSSENSRNRIYKERVRNSHRNSISETIQNSQEEDVNSDNGGRNLKSTESSQSSSSEIEPETLFNPSAFPVNSQVQYIFYEFEILQVLVGRLIGRKGAFVNKIKAATDATIIVGPHKNRKYKICSVEGSREQVNLALDMIREYFPLSRYPDLTLEQVFNRSPATAPPVETTINSQAMQQIELAAGVVVEVRVSAVVSGNELWVQQPLHPSYSALQRLQSCMNINYGDGSTTPPLAPHIGEGIICVAQINSQWYRCQVLSTSEDFAIVVLLDVGGTVSVPALELRQIRRDYMTLPFQAAQCLLHGIQPVSEEGWDETSAVVLEELVSGAILFATVVSYTQDGVPLVNLYRREQDEYVYLNERLVNLGHAQWIAPSPAS